jgi:hypothetical protein
MKRIDWSAAKAVYVDDPTFTLRRRFMVVFHTRLPRAWELLKRARRPVALPSLSAAKRSQRLTSPSSHMKKGSGIC